jgi:hypothetical protein
LQIGILAENGEALRQEMGETFEKFVMAYEVTRELGVQIGALTIPASQRVMKLEEPNGKA